MIFKKLNSTKEVNVPLDKYKIKWDKKISGPQLAVKNFLFPYWKAKYILEEFRIPGSKLRIDLVNISDRIIIEVSPSSTHGEFNEFFHKNKFNYVRAIKRDLEKPKWAEENGFQFVEVFDEDIENLSLEWFEEKYNITL